MNHERSLSAGKWLRHINKIKRIRAKQLQLSHFRCFMDFFLASWWEVFFFGRRTWPVFRHFGRNVGRLLSCAENRIWLIRRLLVPSIIPFLKRNQLCDGPKNGQKRNLISTDAKLLGVIRQCLSIRIRAEPICPY